MLQLGVVPFPLLTSNHGKSFKIPTLPISSSTTYLRFPTFNGCGNAGILQMSAPGPYSPCTPPLQVAHKVSPAGPAGKRSPSDRVLRH